ncbi:hypothetical protein OG539_32920 [Actinacidiphila glaucinigra]|uniref:hypothetical protein n=1 Tax=Actinacidiphila glaucinigra TaxID=235986 RepID=UPI003252A3FA
MTLELRPIRKPHSFDLFEGEQQVGEIRYSNDRAAGTQYWDIEVWSQMGTGKSWSSDTAKSHEEAQALAHELYAELVAERRELRRPDPQVRVISTPMGGQKRR